MTTGEAVASSQVIMGVHPDTVSVGPDKNAGYTVPMKSIKGYHLTGTVNGGQKSFTTPTGKTLQLVQGGGAGGKGDGNWFLEIDMESINITIDEAKDSQAPEQSSAASGTTSSADSSAKSDTTAQKVVKTINYVDDTTGKVVYTQTVSGD